MENKYEIYKRKRSSESEVEKEKCKKPRNSGVKIEIVKSEEELDATIKETQSEETISSSRDRLKKDREEYNHLLQQMTSKGSSIYDVTVFGGQGFCDDSTKALVRKSVTMGEEIV